MATLDRYSRIRTLLGDESFTYLQNRKILLLGAGGVGGFCLDALIRSGVQNITIVDKDRFEITNQNRQIGSEAVGEIKAQHLAILYPNITPIHANIDEAWIKSHDFTKYDLVIDAIDDMKAKVQIPLHVKDKLISSMGGAKKLDPTQIRIDSVWKTSGDALAKKFRYELRKAGFEGDFQVVYSPESSNCEGLGSFVGVTGSFGLALASLAIKSLLKDALHPL
jgi:tRNA A37 threonylcarbamoyladenosine dehydratase